MNFQIDFVIPLHKNNIIFRTTIESIVQNYFPGKIYIITNASSIKELSENYTIWNLNNTKLVIIDEDTFFLEKFNLSRKDIEEMYVSIDDQSREFGWWYQQIIKLGAFDVIQNLSNPYIVWDSDLILLDKWEILPTVDCPFFKFAILQESAKNKWNHEEYKKSIQRLISIDAKEPEEGTFVPHHFIFYNEVLTSFVQNIEEKHDMLWIECIMRLSKDFYRFSEYKCIASYMTQHFPRLLHYHTFDKYGKRGIRYRDCKEILLNIFSVCNIDSHGLSYSEFLRFINIYYHECPSYIQIEHVG